MLSALAYLFILTVYLRTKKNFWCDVGTDSAPDPAVLGEGERLLQPAVARKFERIVIDTT